MYKNFAGRMWSGTREHYACPVIASKINEDVPSHLCAIDARGPCVGPLRGLSSVGAGKMVGTV